MSNLQQSYQAGETKGQSQAKVDQWTDQAKDTAHSAQEKAQEGQQEASGFLQQTGEQVKHMAQGAMDSVKNTLGVNDNKSQ